MTASRAPAKEAGTILLYHVDKSSDRLDSSIAFEMLWKTSSLLAKLSTLLKELSPSSNPSSSSGHESLQSPMLEITGLRHEVDQICMLHAQRQDYCMQIKAGLEKMLRLLISAEDEQASVLRAVDLFDIYVSEEQRQSHAQAMAKFEEVVGQRVRASS